MRATLLFPQATKSIQFKPVFGSHPLSFDSTYYIGSKDSIQFTALRFYVSNIELLNHNKTVWKETTSFHLIDAANEKSMQIHIPSNVSYDKLKINLGIDSATNVAGALGGDLDPTKGMYWTWQSGYINFKLEGNSNLCKTRHNEFQFHLGGYQYPNNSLQTVFINSKEQATIEIVMDIKKIIEQIHLTEQNHIMSPGKEAIELSEKVINSLSIKQ